MKDQLSFLNWKNQRKIFANAKMATAKNTRTVESATGAVFQRKTERRHQERPFGGSLLTGHRKSTRPLSLKHALHLVFFVADRHGSQLLLRPDLARMARRVVGLKAKNHQIQLLDFVNTGRQLHLTVKIQNRESLANFLRASSGIISRRILKKERGKIAGKIRLKESLWLCRPFSRIVNYLENIRMLFQILLESPSFADKVMPELYDLGENHLSSA